MPDFSSFTKKIGISFNNLDLLVEAFTHRSYLNEHPDYTVNHNERLEFLGDAVLDLAVTDFLFKKFPAKSEGELTRYYSALVNSKSLTESAEMLNIDDFILLSKGEPKNVGPARKKRLENTLEAIIGAIYLDSGYAAAETFIAKNIYNKIDTIIATRSHHDAKSRVQEIVQKEKNLTPKYKVLSEEGPVHAPSFTVALFVGEKEIAQGTGKTKQEAEQVAAENALSTLKWS